MRHWRELGARDKASNIGRAISHLFPNSKPIKVLEVGCGTGDVLNKLHHFGRQNELWGIEIGEGRLEQPAIEVSSKIQLSYYDGETIPFDDQSFDFVYSTHVVEHVHEPRRFISEMVRVSKGAIFIEVPLELGAYTTSSRLQRSLDIGHINTYSFQSFHLLLETSGLRVEKFQLYDHSLDVHRHHSSAPLAFLKAGLRRSALAVSGKFATQIFSYHCGAICRPKG